jgi:hypothetical protein
MLTSTIYIAQKTVWRFERRQGFILELKRPNVWLTFFSHHGLIKESLDRQITTSEEFVNPDPGIKNEDNLTDTI